MTKDQLREYAAIKRELRNTQGRLEELSAAMYAPKAQKLTGTPSAPSPDNAAMERFFGRLKNEFFHCRDWRGVGYERFRERLAAYLTHSNETRIKKSLGWQSPVQYRKSLGLAA